MDFALILLTLLNIIIIFLLLKRKTDHSAARFDAIGNALERLEKNIKDEFRYLQENTSKGARENREAPNFSRCTSLNDRMFSANIFWNSLNDSSSVLWIASRDCRFCPVMFFRIWLFSVRKSPNDLLSSSRFSRAPLEVFSCK